MNAFLKLGVYSRLMRLHKPVGILLLWFPTAWALWIANHQAPPLDLIGWFFFGTVCMRSAGCVVNDIADRHVDKHVKRTQSRPLVAGNITLVEAFILLFLLFCLAFLIVVQLPPRCLYYAIVALCLTILYPFCKRFFQAPQLVLGIAFSMGIPMAYVASGVAFDCSAILLFVLNFAWIVSYDTMYAMVDREDDERIGVKSTAVLFARHDCFIILLLQLFFHALWIFLAIELHLSKWFYTIWFIAAWILVYQQQLIRRVDTVAYFAAFSTNNWYGLLMWLALFHLTSLAWL